MARATFVNKARKAYKAAGIKKGESYYWWQFRFGPKIRSKTRPSRSQLTQSAFYGTLWAIQDSVEKWECAERADVASNIENMVSDLEELRDEQEEKRSNMPEQLQESDSGNMLQERYDSLEEYINALNEIKDLAENEDGEETVEELMEQVSSCDCSV